MKKQSMKKQAMVTAGSNAVIRGLGFVMRLWVSKALGAEAVGIMEFSSGAHMLALTPAAAGLPGAVSRLTARAENESSDPAVILCAGRQLALRLALIICPLFFILSPLLSRWLGDERALPSLMLFSPCVLFVGLSSVYDGYCYGKGNAWPPCMSELMEQAVRIVLTLSLLRWLPALTVAWRAAVPAFASTAGEGVGLIVSLAWVGRIRVCPQDERLKETRKKLLRLSAPLMANRMCHTALRTVSASLIPARLIASGLTKSESMSRLGMLSGMVMPLLFLPGMLSGALGTVGSPAAARCASRQDENRLALRLSLLALLAGAGCALSLYMLAPIIALRLYRLPEIAPLLRAMLPMALLMPLQQVFSGIMAGLGLQKKTLRASMLGGIVTLMFTYLWAARPVLRVFGAGYASMLGHFVTLLCTCISFFMR